MNAINYDREMQAQITAAGERKKLLLHCCCAPCSTACLERLYPHFEICALFYNPNLEEAEYLRRKSELIKFIARTGYAEILDCDGEFEKYYAAVKGLESEPEGGKRCGECFKLRLEKCERLATENGFDYFATTLTVSPLKDAALINAIGESVQREGGAKWLYSDFKKRDGYLRSCNLSREHGLYRQNYCGCVFSRKAGEKVEKP